jgi:hypothetical protein
MAAPTANLMSERFQVVEVLGSEGFSEIGSLSSQPVTFLTAKLLKATPPQVCRSRWRFTVQDGKRLYVGNASKRRFYKLEMEVDEDCWHLKRKPSQLRTGVHERLMHLNFKPPLGTI